MTEDAKRPTESEVWSRLDAVPRFNDTMTRGVIDIAEGRETEHPRPAPLAEGPWTVIDRTPSMHEAIDEGLADGDPRNGVRFRGEPEASTPDPTPAQG